MWEKIQAILSLDLVLQQRTLLGSLLMPDKVNRRSSRRQFDKGSGSGAANTARTRRECIAHVTG